MTGQQVRLRIVGAGGRNQRIGTLDKIIPEAVEWVGRGYTVALSTATHPTRILELTRTGPDDQHATVVEPTGPNHGDEGWMNLARNLIRATPLKRSTPT